MASFNITLEDHSPLITYAPAGAWTDTPANDSLASDYSDASFHTTSAQDASATIQFNGTGISIFGGKRSNYGTFKLTVDGNSVAEASASSSSSSTKQLLASASGLEDGPHTAVFTHVGGGAIDIDSAVLEARVGSGSVRLTQKDIDDSDSSITYAPATSWNTNSRPEFINNTLRFTSSPDATASMSFFGDAVAIYGTVAPDHSDFQITLDGKQMTLRGGAGGMVRTLRPKSLLYFASNLGMQDHQITLQSVSTPNAPFLDLDGITVYSAVKSNNNQASPTGAAPTDSQSTPPSNTAGAQGAQTSKGTSKTTIIAASVGGGLGFLLLLALGLFLFFRRRRRQRRAYVDDDLSPKSPHLPIQKPRFSEAPSTIANRWSFQTPFVPQSRVTSVASSYESTAPMMKDVPIIKPPSPARMSNTSSAVGSNRPMSRCAAHFVQAEKESVDDRLPASDNKVFSTAKKVRTIPLRDRGFEYVEREALVCMEIGEGGAEDLGKRELMGWKEIRRRGGLRDASNYEGRLVRCSPCGSSHEPTWTSANGALL